MGRESEKKKLGDKKYTIFLFPSLSENLTTFPSTKKKTKNKKHLTKEIFFLSFFRFVSFFV